MSKTVYPSQLNGEITPPPSKSISHRALIMGALAEPGTVIHNLLQSEDVKATLNGLEMMGATFAINKDYIMVKSPIQHGANAIDCANSGTSIRLLSGIASMFSQKTTLFGDDSLNQRPMKPLLDVLKKMNIKVSNTNHPPISVQGPVTQKTLHLQIQGNISSQFISSIFILSAVRGDTLETNVEIIPPVVSEPYIQLTIELLKEFDIKITKTSKHSYTIISKTRLEPQIIHVPSDFSSAAFFIAASVLKNNTISVNMGSKSYTQADENIIKIINSLGAEIEYTMNVVKSKSSKLKGREIDLAQSPDIFPILCLVASQSNGQTKLYGAKHLKFKETNRIDETVKILSELGIKISAQDDGAIVTRSKVRGGITIDPKGDHRLAMMAAIAATIAEQPVEIRNAECVSVSYPTFFEDLNTLSTTQRKTHE